MPWFIPMGRSKTYTVPGVVARPAYSAARPMRDGLLGVQ